MKAMLIFLGVLRTAWKKTISPIPTPAVLQILNMTQVSGFNNWRAFMLKAIGIAQQNPGNTNEYASLMSVNNLLFNMPIVSHKMTELQKKMHWRKVKVYGNGNTLMASLLHISMEVDTHKYSKLNIALDRRLHAFFILSSDWKETFSHNDLKKIGCCCPKRKKLGEFTTKGERSLLYLHFKNPSIFTSKQIYIYILCGFDQCRNVSNEGRICSTHFSV